jgi:glycerate 2-kinase
MKILIAIDSFKDSLTSKEAGNAIRRGILREFGQFDVRIVPMADGGEGTDEALLEAAGGKRIQVKVSDPLLREINSSFVILGDEKTAVIEMANASGLELLLANERNPWITSTVGTGQLIIEALNRKCRRIIVAIGGSSTIDAGVGMAQALGVKFTDKKGMPVGYGGGELSKIQNIDDSLIDPRLASSEIIVACDVTNQLTGPTGASIIYGSQKGADPKMMRELDRNLKHLAEVVAFQTGKKVDAIPGSGAAGGLGAGLLAFTNAVLKPGFEIVRQEVGLDEHIQWADLIITGEGKLDAQTRYGKTPMGVAGVAKTYNKPVIAIAGTLGEGYQELYPLGFNAIFSAIDKPMSLHEALITAPELLERCARNIIRLWVDKGNKKAPEQSPGA